MEKQRIAHFECIEERGRGMFAVVWEARDTHLDRTVALKVLEAVESRERFEQEAQVAAGLRHDHIVSVFHSGVTREGTYFIAYDLIDGGSLRQWARFVQPRPDELGRMLVGIADALAYAHEQGVVHRDLKPENILVDISDRAYVTDFGLAQVSGSRVTRDDVAIGTVAYMSPEQAAGDGRPLDGRSDLFSLGVVLFELLTGELPLRGASCADYLAQLRWRDAAPVLSINRNVPRDLAAICDKCLAREPRYRYRDARQLAEDLRRFLAGQPVAARPLGRLARAGRLIRRHPLPSGLAGALAGAIIAAAAILLHFTAGIRQANQNLEVERLSAIQSLVTVLLEAPPDTFPDVIARLRPIDDSGRVPLEAASSNPEASLRSRFRALLALAHLADPTADRTRRLLEMVPLVQAEELGNVLITGLRRDPAETRRQIRPLASEAFGQAQGRYCLLALFFAVPEPALHVAALDEDQSDRHELINVAATWQADIRTLLAAVRQTNDAPLLSAILTGVAERDPAALLPAERELLSSEFLEAYAHPHAGVHSAAVYALKRWGIDPPSSASIESASWYRHPLGVTFVRIPPREPADEPLQLRIDAAYYISATEVPLEICQRILGGSDAETERVLQGLRVLDGGSANRIGPKLARELCNLFSVAEGHSQFYGEPVAGEDALPWEGTSGGYRLPTRDEWEWAARSRSTTQYFFGHSPAGLVKYSVCRDVAAATGETSAVHPAATRRPNPFGLFDIYGNVAELATHEGGLIVCGGSSWHDPGDCTSASHSIYQTVSTMIGLRLVRNE